ncbi:hypothetical protein EOW77_0033685 [Bradyrhizobium yuanmingense]|uniref:hypothetical protein n=1 Tax=Bradyrhizobium yuanmingense TaxID=108015 RepID=UPI000FE3B7FE|nr:hypothetical protein [Bradyrhizobium yuanmingense]TGN74446.1 hypothetical protein EOW77_0033685 [Bradyrhizobium yuanmingense]
MSAPVAASVQYLQPVFGIAAVAMMFGDTLLLFGAGGVLIITGLAPAAATRRKARGSCAGRMSLVVLKLILPLILAASLARCRWGDAIGGLLVACR